MSVTVIMRLLLRERLARFPVWQFVTTDGIVVGQHKGITHYTIGQRKGLIFLGYPVFGAIRPETNEVVLGNDKDVFTDHLIADRVNFMADK